MPKVFAALALLYGALDRRTSPIEPPLRSLITVRVSQIKGCRFCVDLNSFLVLRRGLEPEKLAAIADFDTSPLFSEREKAALTYAEAVTDSAAAPRRSTSSNCAAISMTMRSSISSPKTSGGRESLMTVWSMRWIGPCSFRASPMPGPCRSRHASTC
jgi:AhpD family alkylhydroperoxidase